MIQITVQWWEFAALVAIWIVVIMVKHDFMSDEKKGERK